MVTKKSGDNKSVVSVLNQNDGSPKMINNQIQSSLEHFDKQLTSRFKNLKSSIMQGVKAKEKLI